MKITEDTIDAIPIKDRKLIQALFNDVEEINHNASCFKFDIYIDWINQHTEYSPEWTDPCPDFYGMYRIRRSDNDDVLGVEMDLDTLDTSLCLLHNYLIYE